MVAEDGPVRVEVLREGATFGAIANAAFALSHPMSRYDRFYDGDSYYISDGQGAFGSITFTEKGVVGTCFDVHSRRASSDSSMVREVIPLHSVVPTRLHEALESNSIGKVRQHYPDRVTAVFWSEDSILVAGEPWKSAMAQGASVLKLEMTPLEIAIPLWQNEYEFSSEQVKAAYDLYEFKRRQCDQWTLMAIEKVGMFLPKDGVGIEQGREAFADLGIILR